MSTHTNLIYTKLHVVLRILAETEFLVFHHQGENRWFEEDTTIFLTQKANLNDRLPTFNWCNFWSSIISDHCSNDSDNDNVNKCDKFINYLHAV
jgi:hypothetical protein